MNEIRRVLKVAAWRLFVVDLFRTLAVMASAAVGALIAVLLAERLFGLLITGREWAQIAGVAAGAAALSAAAWSLVRRSRGVAVARELDERANLRESLSTAMCVAGSDDPWARMVVETARQRAAGVKVRQAIPMAAPRMWPVPLAMLLSMAILWFSLPHWDVLGKRSARMADAAQKNEIKAVSAEVKQLDEKMKELLKQAKVELKDEPADAETAENKPTTPDEIRRAAVKKLTAMTDQLNDKKAGEQAKTMEAIKQAMKQLKQPGPGPLDNLSKSLAKGDFKKAQEDLQELSKQLANNQMSPEEKAKAQEQLKKLAEQLDKVAKATEEMEKKLQEAGMSKEAAKAAAKDPEAMKKAIEELKNLTQEQKQELMKQMAAQAAAAKQCDGMSEAMSKMSEGMGKQGMNQEGNQGMEALAGQLSQMEMMAADLDAMDAAMSECMGQLAKLGSQCKGMGNCEGDGDLMFKDSSSPWKAGDTSKKGGGRGGPGQSGGSNAGDEQETGVNVSKAKTPTKQGQGPMIGSTMVQGDQVKGESVLAFQEAVESSAKAATEAIEKMDVPKELEPAVKGYFGRLEAKSKSAKK